MVVDQSMMAPLVNSFVLISLEALHGANLSTIKEKYKTVFPELLKNNYKLWPLAQIVNFYLVPLEHK